MTHLLRTLVTLAALVFVVGCAAGDDPADTTESFFQALNEGDYEEARDLVTESSTSQIDEAKEDDANRVTFENITIGEAKVDGDRATVPTTFKVEGNELSFTTALVKVDGEWKVDFLETSKAMGMGAVGGGMDKIKEGTEEGKKAMDEMMKDLEGEGDK